MSMAYIYEIMGLLVEMMFHQGGNKMCENWNGKFKCIFQLLEIVKDDPIYVKY